MFQGILVHSSSLPSLPTSPTTTSGLSCTRRLCIMTRFTQACVSSRFEFQVVCSPFPCYFPSTPFIRALTI
ncbi:hypothetical protein M404DRAFT_736933 [Pisolithus tinctorius Marx 270]|uniref:Uncharacterized protein n=1 Tax=Pisolithus tinctorius Marx 270 TaxID=870435 RepID=A0A0C3P1I6_PISTI|nr:hypothetical protein M404DRAFT_736933 [Pisolithus tinctorius Marx 270]